MSQGTENRKWNGEKRLLGSFSILIPRNHVSPASAPVCCGKEYISKILPDTCHLRFQCRLGTITTKQPFFFFKFNANEPIKDRKFSFNEENFLSAVILYVNNNRNLCLNFGQRLQNVLQLEKRSNDVPCDIAPLYPDFGKCLKTKVLFIASDTYRESIII